ncbi:ScbR family autoregulator-binding transcription factor [Streptomyces sp. NPDC059874]|uniref:ScbR family autoregulator-binding transcription factor n=1 Tax=Streptomyces sp. NPDC059874 TaxID=3346983 RepID=UPI0036491503
MAEQVRAVRTRQAILSAAAKVFEDHGYQAATISQILTEAGVTKGALYFHFQSKEDLAQGVLAEQDHRLVPAAQASKIQQILDGVMMHAYRLQTDPMVRAGVRLSMDQQAHGLDRSGPFLRWSEASLPFFQEAQDQGELLPHVVLTETIDVIVGAFAGVQAMSQAICDYRDLASRVSALMRHLLPSVVVPAVLASLDLSEGRGAMVYAEALKAADEQELVSSTG